MLFDDDFDDQELFDHALKHLGISAGFVTDNLGRHAILPAMHRETINPHFIFVDVDTPKLRGVDCLVEIKKISRVKGRAVYLYSTYTDPKIKKNKSRAAELFKAHNMKELEKILAEKIPGRG